MSDYLHLDTDALDALPPEQAYQAATQIHQQAKRLGAAYADRLATRLAAEHGQARAAELLEIKQPTLAARVTRHKERTMQISDIFAPTDSRETATEAWIEAAARYGYGFTVVSTHDEGDIIAIVRADNWGTGDPTVGGDEYRLHMWGTKQVVATPKKSTTTIEIPVANTTVARAWTGTGVGTWTTEKDGVEWVIYFEGSGSGVTWTCGPRGGGKGILPFKASTTEAALKEATWHMDAKPLIDEAQKNLRA